MGRLILKRENLTNLFDYDANQINNLYTFKGGAVNTISTVFDKNQFMSFSTPTGADSLRIRAPGGSYIAYYVNSTTNQWTTSIGGNDASNIVINEGSTILLLLQNNSSRPVNSGAIIQKYNQGKTSIKKQNLGSGKIKINKLTNLFTCPFEVDTTTCPSVGFNSSGWLKGPNILRMGRTTAPDNSNSAVIYQSINAPDCYVSQGFPQYWRPFTRYQFSIWTKLIAGEVGQGNVINVSKNGSTDRAVLPALGNLTSEWKKFTITFTTDGSYNNNGDYTTAFFAENFNGGTQIALWGAEMFRYD